MLPVVSHPNTTIQSIKLAIYILAAFIETHFWRNTHTECEHGHLFHQRTVAIEMMWQKVNNWISFLNAIAGIPNSLNAFWRGWCGNGDRMVAMRCAAWGDGGSVDFLSHSAPSVRCKSKWSMLREAESGGGRRNWEGAGRSSGHAGFESDYARFLKISHARAPHEMQ